MNHNLDDYTAGMRKYGLIVVSFVAGALLGTGTMLGLLFLAGWAVEFAHRNDHEGIGAVAGGWSEAVVTLVPVLFGVIGVLTVQLWRVRCKRANLRR